MPAAIKLRIVSARDLPVMDSPTDSTDAYVEVCFADTPHLRTRVEKRTLNPTWNQEFRIEVADDCDLQDCPLVLKCIDKDYMTSDDEIGAVCIDLNPLLMQHEQVQLAGWFPLYDTLRGACGELSIVVKMDFDGVGGATTSLWVDPADCAEGTPEVVYEDANNPGFNRIRFQAGNGPAYMDFDEVRLGRSWDDVVPNDGGGGRAVATAGSLGAACPVAPERHSLSSHAWWRPLTINRPRGGR